MISHNYLCNFSPTLVCLNILRFIYYYDSYHQIEVVFKYDLIFILTQYYKYLHVAGIDRHGRHEVKVCLLTEGLMGGKELKDPGFCFEKLR